MSASTRPVSPTATIGEGLRYLAVSVCLFGGIWPITKAGKVSLSAAQLSMLLEGIDWRRPERTWQPRAAA